MAIGMKFAESIANLQKSPSDNCGDLTILLGLATMNIGLRLGFRVFMVTFHAGFDGFLFISLAWKQLWISIAADSMSISP